MLVSVRNLNLLLTTSAIYCLVVNDGVISQSQCVCVLDELLCCTYDDLKFVNPVAVLTHQFIFTIRLVTICSDISSFPFS